MSAFPEGFLNFYLVKYLSITCGGLMGTGTGYYLYGGTPERAEQEYSGHISRPEDILNTEEVETIPALNIKGETQGTKGESETQNTPINGETKSPINHEIRTKNRATETRKMTSKKEDIVNSPIQMPVNIRGTNNNPAVIVIKDGIQEKHKTPLRRGVLGVTGNMGRYWTAMPNPSRARNSSWVHY